MQHHAEWRLERRHVGRRVVVFQEVDSTNTQAALLAEDPHNDGLALLADVQSGGRGQYGRSWQCPAGSGLLMTVLLFPPPELRRPALLTAWAAVAVCETLRSVCGLQAKIKWPNDVLVRGRKVCGILIECGLAAGDPPAGWRRHSTEAGSTFHAVTGIGLNLNQTAEDFAAAGLPQAASVRMFTGHWYERNDVARRLLQVLDEEYERLLQGDLMTLEALWKWRVGLLGRSVRAECLGGIHEGRLSEMGWDGLWLRVPGRPEPVHLPPESVRALAEIS
jgi:BirA family transcriptional regulator, biotin operon repressor / biotin---[acetyl-CoA-carboxylase] ligase